MRRRAALALAVLTIAAGPAPEPAAPTLLPGIPGLSAAEIAGVADAPRKAGCAVKAGEVGPALAQAHARLGITPAQEGAWKQASRSVNEAVAPLAAECDRPAQPPGSWAATMDRLRGDAALAATISRLQQAAQALYGALTPAQQQMLTRAAGSMRDQLPAILSGKPNR